MLMKSLEKKFLQDKKMKLLYISHCLQSSGWGRAARDLCLALDSVGVDVVCRPVKLNGDSYIPTGRFKQLLEKDASGANICISHVLPHFLNYDGHFKRNIAYFVAETLDWNHSGWHHYINNGADELWVPNTEMAENCRDFITLPVKVVPHAMDCSVYSQNHEIYAIPELAGAYNFYFVGEFNRRKRLGALIQAFNLEFKKTEPVNLVLKVYKHGTNPKDLADEVHNLAREIKRGLKLYSKVEDYPQELVVSDYLDEKSLFKLHNTCDCFVNTSFGEAWMYPACDAMGMGNKVISGNYGGPRDFLSEYTGAILVDGEYVSVIGMNDTFQNYNTGRERWYNTSVEQIRRAMRHCYKSGKRKTKTGIDCINKFSYENVGKVMKSLLEGKDDGKSQVACSER
jgi:glycosyltransferase involved in cell wall biosynthesis